MNNPISTPPNRGVSVNAQNICVGYGDNIIIDDLSVDFPSGEITTIIGPTVVENLPSCAQFPDSFPFAKAR